jgi:hypothetical protein
MPEMKPRMKSTRGREPAKQRCARRQILPSGLVGGADGLTPRGAAGSGSPRGDDSGKLGIGHVLGVTPVPAAVDSVEPSMQRVHAASR